MPVALAKGATGTTCLRLVLHPSGAIWLPDEAALLVADLHFGKAASFRRLGVPVPEASTGGTLDQLRALLDDLHRLPPELQSAQPVRLVVLGDLLHAARGDVDHGRRRLAHHGGKAGFHRPDVARGHARLLGEDAFLGL